MAETKVMTQKDFFEKYKDRESMEIGKDQIMITTYRDPVKRYRLIYETYNSSIEEAYFWLINYLRYDIGFSQVDKITDVFSASEQSSFFGVAQQRIGLQQDKVSQFLGVIGKMVKELFQLVRELRIIDERMGYYEDSWDAKSRSRDSAEITLKGVWVDMVEQANKNPASVYGMAQQLQFTTLPDLFFSTHPPTQRDVDLYVDRLDFNRKVKEVLKRKLRTYMAWKETTYGELKTKRGFTLKYLRQHYRVIQMYMSFVKPYLKNIVRMNMNEEMRDAPDIIAAFETSTIEIEVLGKAAVKDTSSAYAVILLNLGLRTTPQMSYQAEGYNRGPLHVGEVKITYRAYGWTEEEIEDYKAMRRHEDFELLTVVDESIRAAMEALGDELFKYLREAGDTTIPANEDKKKAESPKKSIFEPVAALAGGFKDMFDMVVPMQKKKDKNAPSKDKVKGDKEKAAGHAKLNMWLSYKNFKKSHKMITW